MVSFKFCRQTHKPIVEKVRNCENDLNLSLSPLSPQLIRPRGCDLSFRRRGCSDWRYHTWLMGSNDQLRMPIMPKIFGASRLTRNWGNHKISWHFMIMIRLRVLENKWNWIIRQDPEANLQTTGWLHQPRRSSQVSNGLILSQPKFLGSIYIIFLQDLVGFLLSKCKSVHGSLRRLGQFGGRNILFSEVSIPVGPPNDQWYQPLIVQPLIPSFSKWDWYH